ncbi:MAG: acyl--CoA ligase [Candidatus Marinimicrobia bacterium]|nr:acyl--CoA ligase [Candidatus Neomarinimicrobiota bacterium]
MKDLIQYISENKNTNPNKVFLKTSAGDFSYKEIALKINNLSCNLYKPLYKQRHIGILIDDSIEFILSFLAIQKNSDIAVLLPVKMDPEILIQKINSLNLSVIIYHEKYRSVIQKSGVNATRIVIGEALSDEENFQNLLQQPQSFEYRIPFLNIENPALIIFTSGSMGIPKNILLSHKNLLHNSLACQKIIQNTKNLNYIGYPDFTNFISLILVLGLAVTTNGSITIPDNKSDDTILKIIKEKKVNVFVSVPKNLKNLLDHSDKGNLSVTDYTLSVGENLDENFVEMWTYKFNSTLMLGYGLAESLIVSFNLKNDSFKPASMGKPLADCEMKIMNAMQVELPIGHTGELHIKSTANLISYYNSEKNKNFQNKWVATGDLVKKDFDGYYHYVDKKSNIIHRNGFIIFPTEIEKIIGRHPKIKQIHVLKLLGEKDDNIKFCVVAEDSDLTVKEVKDYAKENLPLFLHPDFIEIYNEFPEDPLGKILRHKFIHSH